MARNRLMLPAFSILVVMTGLGLWLVMREDGDSGPSGAVGSGSDGAAVFETREDACAAFLDDPVGKSVSESVARDDAGQLGERLVSIGGDVVMVGMSLCDDEWVVHVGVSRESASVPETGPRGTPVLAFLQEEFHAG